MNINEIILEALSIINKDNTPSINKTSILNKDDTPINGNKSFRRSKHSSFDNSLNYKFHSAPPLAKAQESQNSKKHGVTNNKLK